MTCPGRTDHALAGIKPSTIAMRINKYRWSLVDALTKGATL
jgi:hypothetical protein